MTNTKYTTLEQSQRLKEIGFEAEADGWWNGSLELEGYYEYWIDQLEDKPLGIYNKAVYRTCPSYRLDTLLLALPEWIKEVISMSYGWCDSDRERFIRWIWYIKWLKKHEMIFDEIYSFDFYSDNLFTISNEVHNEFMQKENIHVKQIRACDNQEIPRIDEICFGGPEAIAATVDLICLLKEVEINDN